MNTIHTRDYTGRKYLIVPYNPQWPQQFKAESEKLATIFGTDALSIHHVGSTAVPGMAGKPLLDILILVDSLAVVPKHEAAMENAGFTSDGDLIGQGGWLFSQTKDGYKMLNIHIFEKDSPHVTEMLAMRDYLRNHPKEAQQYSELKLALFKKYPNDYGSYREGKSALMNELQNRALKE